MKSKAEPFAEKTKPFTDIEDAGFRAKLTSGDDDAFTKFYNYYFPQVFHLIN